VAAVARVTNQPASGPVSGAAIDTEHLSRMTLGELSLQREVLALFDRQADMLLPRIRQGAPATAAASAHTLKGSAVGIGAFKVARAVEEVEQAQGLEIRDTAITAAVDTLAAVLDEAKAEIARLLQVA
jgi:HPt (histidine-containing phosphotransfer) domain-containing protein